MLAMPNRRGLTLVELMIAVALIGLGIMAAIGSFNSIHKAIQASKGHMLASNIAQEKVQVLMQKSYYEVLVTTYPAYVVEGSSTIVYDPGYFPPETVTEGGMTFTRYTYIQVAQENSGLIVTLPPSTSDTGMRLITETVIWKTADGDKFLSVQNVLNNPNTVMSNSVLNGVVRDSNTLATIQYALVNAAENIGWQDSTDSHGNYSINLSPGFFNFRASAPGYYSKIIPLTIGANSTVSQNFYLNPISTGAVQGSVWMNNHLVISQVVASTGPANAYEYIELYNPSTATINMGSNATYTTPNVWVVTADASGGAQPTPTLVYISTYVPPNGFYLITNTGDGAGTPSCLPVTVNGVSVNPDACWRTAGYPNHLLGCSNLPGGGGGCGIAQNASGFCVGSNGSASWSGIASLYFYDCLAWTGAGATPHTYEYTPAVPSLATGMDYGEDFVRRLDTGTSWTTSFGNAYDSNNNSIDFIDHPPASGGPPFAPRTIATIRRPVTGSPVPGAIVSSIDGLSTPSSATLQGIVPYAGFFIPGVATGTWTVFVDSGTSSAEIDSATVVAQATTTIINAATTPAWLTAGESGIILSTNGVTGMINGKVTDALGTPLSGITVTVGSLSVLTSAAGTYYMRLSTGIYDVVANPNNMNGTYAEQTDPGQTVNLADVTTNVNFALSMGGRISGWLSRDGLNPLPSVTVVALDVNGIARDTEITGANGDFLLINLTTGTYSVQPVLDPKEIATPTSISATVTAGVTVWSGSFTITGAMGSVAGSVTASGKPISSGVLVVVSTGALNLPLPSLSSATLATSAYYANSSKEDGTYSVDVRSSTSTTYVATAFYMYLNNQTPVISSRTVSGITVTGGGTTSGINFSW